MKFDKANRLQNVKEYYFSTKLREVRLLLAKGKPIINLGIGSPDLTPPPEVIKAITEAALHPGNHGYQNYQGIPELRNSIALFYKKNYGVELDPDHEILPLMGSKEGILHISMAYLNKGDAVLIPNPGYPTYTSVTRLVEARPVFYDLKSENNWYPDLEKLEEKDLSKVKIMWINYPHMPTGTNPVDELFEQLITFAKKHKILLVNDNPYSFILNDSPKSILSYKGAKEVAIELNSLSKTFNMAGWRVGMVLGNKENIKNILQIKSNMDSGMFYGIQKGAVAALNLTSEWLNEMNKVYQKRREIVWEICDALECDYNRDSSGLFVWAKIPQGKRSEAVTDDLLYRKDVFVAPGTVFGSNGEGYIRFSLCVTEEKLKEVLKRIA